MKKRNKIRIFGKKVRTKWLIVGLAAVLLCALIVMFLVLSKFYLFSDKNSKNTTVPENNIVSYANDAENKYVIFSNEEGLYGIKDIYGRNVTEPGWNNVYFLENDRFAVEQKIGETTELAVLDSEGNLITPFIFSNIEHIGGKFLAGYLSSQEGFALLDTEGNILTDRTWTNSEYNEKNDTVILTDLTGKYSYKFENNLLLCTSVTFDSIVSNCDIGYLSDDKALIEEVSIDRMYTMFDSACIYFSALLSENKENISEITNEQYLDTLSANILFRNCTVKNIKNIQIKSDENDSVGYMFSAEVLYNYDGEDVSIENLKSLVSLHFVEDENYRIILKSVNKKEI